MNRIGISLLAASLGAAVLPAQNLESPRIAASLSKTLDGSFAQAEKEFVPAVEAMDEGKFDFVPGPGEFKKVRTFAAQAKHVGAVNYMLGAAILGEKPPAAMGGEDGPEAVKTKAEVLAYLKASYEYAHKAIRSISDRNALLAMKAPFGSGETSRVALAQFLLAHTMDHYGQIVVSLRMNGIVPPTSR
jgi:uncharacterized damage-inducible protein DinB